MKLSKNFKRATLAATIVLGLAGGSSAANWVPLTTGPHNWNLDSNWAPDPFPNGAGAVANLAVNQSANQTVNLNVPITVGSLTFGDTSGAQTQTIAPNGGSLILNNSGGTAILARGGGGTGATTISAPISLVDSVDISNSQSGLLTLSGLISGPGGINKLGTTSVTLSGANTYSGDTVVNTGTLAASGGLAIPEGPGKGNVIINSGATLSSTASNNERINGLTGLGTLALGTRTFHVGNNNATSAFSGLITGTGTFRKAGTGTTTLDGVAKAVNNLRVSHYGGVLQLDYATVGSGLISNSAANLVLSGGTIELFGQSAGTTTQTFAAALLNDIDAKDNTLKLTPNGGGTVALTLTSGQISRAIGTGLNFVLPVGATITTTGTASTTNGILNASTATSGGTNSLSG